VVGIDVSEIGPNPIPIVLTGTIIPNAIKTVHCDWKKRRSEYLHSISYYKKFSKVYFLENSHYDLSNDNEFSNDERFQYYQFAVSKGYEKGKGYQEFQMLDEFVKHRLDEDCFLKVTGRYIYDNFDEIYAFIHRNRHKNDLIIDSFFQFKKAITSLFFIKKDIYLLRLQDCYLNMDDSKDLWAEHIVYNALKNIRCYTFFPKVFLLSGISGSTGYQYRVNEKSAKIKIKNLQRKVFSVFGIKQLLR